MKNVERQQYVSSEFEWRYKELKLVIHLLRNPKPSLTDKLSRNKTRYCLIEASYGNNKDTFYAEFTNGKYFVGDLITFTKDGIKDWPIDKSVEVPLEYIRSGRVSMDTQHHGLLERIVDYLKLMALGDIMLSDRYDSLIKAGIKDSIAQQITFWGALSDEQFYRFKPEQYNLITMHNITVSDLNDAKSVQQLRTIIERKINTKESEGIDKTTSTGATSFFN